MFQIQSKFWRTVAAVAFLPILIRDRGNLPKEKRKETYIDCFLDRVVYNDAAN
jgi:hypothetical protein